MKFEIIVQYEKLKQRFNENLKQQAFDKFQK